MKKTLSIVLVLVMALSLLAGCNQTPAPTPTPDPVPETPTIVKVGLGSVLSIAKSKDAATDVTPVGQADVTVAAVGFDKDGKILSVDIDTAQTKIAFDAAFAVTSDLTAEVPSKTDLGDDYGMKKASGIEKEWFEQMAALEEWMIGKTIEEVKAMPMDEDGYPTDADMVASVTMNVAGYIDAVEQAWTDAIEVEGGATVGLGVKTLINKSKGYSMVDGKETLPLAQADTYVAAVAFDADDKVVGAVIDTAQVKIKFDAAGVVTNREDELMTKQELKEGYNMKGASGIEKEWYEQANALAAWMVGQTAEEISAMPLDEGGYPTDADVLASVTVHVTEYLAVVAEAFTVAK